MQEAQKIKKIADFMKKKRKLEGNPKNELGREVKAGIKREF